MEGDSTLQVSSRASRRRVWLLPALALVAAVAPGCRAPRQPAPLAAKPPMEVDSLAVVRRPTAEIHAASFAKRADTSDGEVVHAELLETPVEELAPVSQPGWTLDSLIATALALHPEIEAARQRVAAATHRVPQAKALPDPMFSNTFWPIHDQALQTAAGRIGNQMAISQQVPWPSKLHARSAVAMREIEVARAEVAEAELEITRAVRLAYYELWLTEETIRILEDNRELVSDLVAVAEARYKTGGSQQDVLRAESEADRIEDQLILLREKLEQTRTDLGTLVGQPLRLQDVSATAPQADVNPPELELLVASLEQCNPTLRGLAAEFARERAKECLACQQQYPDLQFGLGWGLVSDDDDVLSPVANGHDNLNFTIGVTLPVWRDKIHAGVREAAHMRTSALQRRSAASDRLRGDVRRYLATAQAALEQRQLLEQRLVPRTEQTLKIATADYQGKRTDFFNLIDIYRELLRHQVQLARTRAELASALAQIDHLVACPPTY